MTTADTTSRRSLPSLDRIARPGGGLAMVAMDQRESLRTMFTEALAGTTSESPVDDATMTDFKLAVARNLGPLASGFLIDRHYGYPAIRDEGLLGPDTGLILAADALDQVAGGPVEDTSLDPVVVAPDFDRGGVAALKLLVVWRRDDRRAARVDLARSFVAAAQELGLLSVLEPVVRPTSREQSAGTWDADVAVREAAEELSVLGQSLYKVQVPRAGDAPWAELHALCAELDRSITGPWVVLSQGVDRQNFEPAVTAACQAGASGFLAGRALWSDVVGAPDVDSALLEQSVPRLRRLIAAVDAHARPWHES